LPYPVPISPNNACLNCAARDRTKRAERDARLEGGFQLKTFEREGAERALVGLLETYVLHWLAPCSLLIGRRVQATVGAFVKALTG
jgi:hypothetical protein